MCIPPIVKVSSDIGQRAGLQHPYRVPGPLRFWPNLVVHWSCDDGNRTVALCCHQTWRYILDKRVLRYDSLRCRC